MENDDHVLENKGENTDNNACEILNKLRVRNHNRIIIGNLNINSIANKFEQLKSIIRGKIDILIITETKLDESFPNAQFFMEGYSEPYRMDRDRNGGGILIYVRDDIPSKKLSRHTFPADIEGIFLEINLLKTKWLLYGSYHPPSQVDTYYFDYLERALDIYNNFYTNFLLTGDFNSEETETCMHNLLHQYDAKNLVKEKTCFKNAENPSCIDLFITNKYNSFQNTTVVSTGLSDFHKMAVTVLKSTFVKAKPKEIIYRNYKNFDQDIFKNDLKHSLNISSINTYKDFEEVFLKVLEKHAPIKRKTVRANQAPYITKALRKAMMKRSELETKFYKTKTQSSYRAYKKQKNFVSRLYKKERKCFYTNLDLNKICDNKKFWKTLQPLFSEKGKISKKITIVKDNEIISADEKVAETLNNFFQNAVNSLNIKENGYLTNPQNNSHDPIEKAIEKFDSHPSILKIKEMVTPTTFLFTEVTLTEVEQELQQLNPKKASTFKNIPPKHLKQSSEVCGSVLKKLVNQAMRDNYFPEELKVADITPTFKKGDATCVKNYRPVSVLPAVSKIYERIIHKQITNHIEKYLSPYLCGYRKGFNTQYALISLIEKWKETLDSHGYAGAILMDLSKAFDTLNHELLIAKLHAYGFSKESLELIFSYLKNRWQRTKINKSFSSWSELILGVPQGSVLGPLLFNIYINDLFWVNEFTNVCNYADDTTFYACDRDLETVLQKLEHDSLLAIEWFENNYMKLNSDKCHLLISGFKHQVHWAKVGDFKIWESPCEKLLGITIDKGLKFDLHVSDICKKAHRKLTALGRISKLIPLNKRKVLFRTYVYSQFAYCPLVWMFHDRNVHNKINHLHERALRIVYKDDYSSFDELLNKDNAITIHQRNIHSLAIELYKSKNDIGIDILDDIFIDNKDNDHKLRVQRDFKTPKVNTVYKGDDSLRHLGPLVWNIVPKELKLSKSLKHFKSELKKWKPKGCLCRLCKPYIQGVGYVTIC